MNGHPSDPMTSIDPTVNTAADVHIRLATPDDAPALCGLVAELEYATPQDVLLERLDALAEMGGETIVAERGGRVVGMATMHATRFLHRPPDMRLSCLVVTEQERSGGIGAVLVADVERRGREAGCARVEVTSGFPRVRAHAFYQREGYEAQSRRFVKALHPTPAGPGA
jgi:N-acetylglutamate synthase-like GNAT family acetyltransferase